MNWSNPQVALRSSRIARMIAIASGFVMCKRTRPRIRSATSARDIPSGWVTRITELLRFILRFLSNYLYCNLFLITSKEDNRINNLGSGPASSGAPAADPRVRLGFGQNQNRGPRSVPSKRERKPRLGLMGNIGRKGLGKADGAVWAVHMHYFLVQCTVWCILGAWNCGAYGAVLYGRIAVWGGRSGVGSVRVHTGTESVKATLKGIRFF